ncbi:type II secretion system major pseudopilin GspG [Acinetobacter sp. AOR15_HL]|uniref:type II secretion system major pseudopilin GspG n=1 Tax=unclassified Acinetobacter TaxID=196816 RepID=UPI0022EB3A2A|nr:MULTISPECIES: type II secretion system major pseudopilin GspG [unclassified Acinetobacter]MDA3556330.1 type II secretion system major pseudopilin GspG [Acinetobacter sp. AOR15_HL]MDA3571787.1 type II secretion system major pseudopilin GspG [Acinetobacter sp. AOR14_HL]
MKKNSLGFTLLELLIVVVIIGLLAGIVGPKLFKNINKSEVTTAKAQIDTFVKALDNFRIDTGRYPTAEEGLKALLNCPNNLQGWNGPYLKKSIPADPWGTPYQYNVPSQHNGDYDVFSFGKDKKLGGENDNTDIGNW